MVATERGHTMTDEVLCRTPSLCRTRRRNGRRHEGRPGRQRSRRGLARLDDLELTDCGRVVKHAVVMGGRQKPRGGEGREPEGRERVSEGERERERERKGEGYSIA